MSGGRARREELMDNGATYRMELTRSFFRLVDVFFIRGIDAATE